jgi:Tat protein translocase TatB subunit
MGIGNIGWTEFVVILAIALVFFGPRRLPGIAQALGKSLREFQKALNEVKAEVARAAEDSDPREEVKRILPRPAEILSNAMIPEDAQPEVTKEAEVTVTPTAPASEADAKDAGAEPTEESPASETAAQPEQTPKSSAGNGDPRSPNVS